MLRDIALVLFVVGIAIAPSAIAAYLETRSSNDEVTEA